MLDTINARIDDLRAVMRAGPVTLEEAAAKLGIPEPDLMAKLAIHELRQRPGSIAVIASADGTAIVRSEGDNLAINVPRQLAEVLLAGLLFNSTASLSVCSPLPNTAITSSHGVH